MSAGDLVTTAWQLELNGVLLGPGTNYLLRDVDLWAAPEVAPAETARAQAHGMFAGRDWLRQRLVTASVAIVAQSTDAAEIVLRQALTAAWQPPSDGTPVPLVWMEDDAVKYRVVGKPRLASPKVSPRMPAECRFVCTDPRIYANAESSASTGLATVSGGLTFAAAAPFVFGSAGAGSTMACTNAGTFPTPWVATFTGPLVAPGLEHVGLGMSISFPSASLAAGETLVVDSAARTVLLNGTASRYSWLSSTSRWFELQAGANSVRLSGSSGAGSVTLTWRSAWL